MLTPRERELYSTLQRLRDELQVLLVESRQAAPLPTPQGRHPMQPVVQDEHGTLRFKKNAIVQMLLDTGKLNMNDLARLPFDKDDRTQFAQLIGYSLGGFQELSNVSEDAKDMAAKLQEEWQ